MKNCKQILIDCDGVLTDGTLTIDANGEKLFKKFHTRDVRAIREFVSKGYEVIIVTADDWSGIFHFAEKVGADVFVSRDKSNLPFDNYIAIGDDAWDVKMLENAKQAFVPHDADISVMNVLGVVRCFAYGGKGVVAEVLQKVLY